MEELLSIARETDALSGTAAEQFYAFGFSQYQAGNWTKAMEVFQILCARRPLNARFWFGLGASLQEKKDYENALRAWAMTALLDPNSPYPHFHAAECSLSLKSLPNASFALKEAETRIKESEHPLKQRISLLKTSWKL